MAKIESRIRVKTWISNQRYPEDEKYTPTMVIG